jgi:hypothetical protein
LYSGLDAVIAGPVSKLSSGALPIPTDPPQQTTGERLTHRRV